MPDVVRRTVGRRFRLPLRTDSRRRALLIVAAGAIGFPQLGRAETLYWDTNGTTAGSGNAGGDWNQSDAANWSTDSAGLATPKVFAEGDAAVFSAGTDNTAATTVTVVGVVNPLSLTFNSQLTTFGVVGADADAAIDFGSTAGAINSSAAGTVTNKQFRITTNLRGTSGLTIAAHGNVSATGGSSNSYFQLGGDNSGLTGGISITSGLVDALNNNDASGNTRVFGSNTITISDQAGIVDANHSTKIANNIVLSGGTGIFRSWGSATTTFTGTLSGAGGMAFTDTGVRVLTGTNTFLGAVKIQAGSVQLGDNTTTGSFATASSVDIASGTTLRVRRSGSVNLTSLVPASLTLTGTLEQRGAAATDELLVTSTLGANTTTGTLRALTGKMTFGSGAVVKAANIQGNAGTIAIAAGADVQAGTLGATGGVITMTGGLADAPTLSLSSTPGNSGTAAIGTLNLQGGTLTTKYANIGNGSNTSGNVNQTGGTLMVVAGGDGFRLGHWGNGLTPGSQYLLTGGTLDATGLSANTTATARVVNIGWDGAGTMVVGGGTGAATVKSFGVVLDGKSANATPNDTLTVTTRGVVEIGGGGLVGRPEDGVILTGGTLRATAATAWSAPISVDGDSTLDTATSRITLSSTLTGGGNLTQAGTGEVAYTGNASEYSGTVTAATGTVSGTNTLGGSLVVGGTLAPGASSNAGTVGTMTVNGNATLNGLAVFDLNGASTTTGNDRVVVGGDLTFGSNAKIKPVLYGTLPTGSAEYTLFTYSGSLNGPTPTIDPTSSSTTRLTFGVNTDTAGAVKVSVSGAAANLVWAGGLASNAWDVNTTSNFINGAASDKFFNFDAVSFTDTGNTASPVLVNAPVQPISVAISADSNYTFAGTSGIVGGATLTKSGAGTLTLLNSNTLGAVTISGGTVSVGNGGTTGAIDGTGTLTIGTGATLKFNRSDAVTFSRAADANSAGTIVKDGTNTLTLSGTLPTNLVVNAGTVNASGGGFSTNRMVGNGQITVNTGGTLIVPSAHALGGDNGTMTESVTVAGGTLTLNAEQYFRNLTLTGGLVNGSAELRSLSGVVSVFQVTGTTPSTVTARVNQVGTAPWTVADVTGSKATDLLISGVVSNTGALTKSGPGTLELSASNTYTGLTTVNGGTLLASGAIGTGASATGTNAVNINAGGTLGGTGGIAGAVNVNLGGTLNPGVAIGTLSIASPLSFTATGTGAAPTLAIDLGTSGVSDKVALTGTDTAGLLSLDSPATLSLFTAGDIATSSTYTVAAFASLSGDFETVLINGVPAQSASSALPNFVSVVYNATSIEVTVNNVTVPEPGVLSLLGGVGLLAMRRRRAART